MDRAVTLFGFQALWLVAFGSNALGIEPTERDVQYAQVDSESLELDLYFPQSQTSPVPLIVWVHGGAWRSGSKDNVPVTRWLEQGFAIASVDYRLTPIAKFPAQSHDIKCAIRFLRGNSERYNLDSKRFVVAGASAGGHLAALVGVSGGVSELEGELGDFQTESSDVQAIVSFYGASNLQSILSQSPPHGLSVRVPALQLLLGGQPEEQTELAKLASPFTHVDATDPPLWLIHGDQDPQMPIEQSRELATLYRQHNRYVHFDVVKGGVHGGKEFYTSARLNELGEEILKSLSSR